MLDFTVKQNNRAVWGFLLPLMLSGGFQYMYAVVNAAVLGRTVNMEAVAVIGACSGFNGLISNLFGGMASGAGFYFSRCVGSGQRERVDRAFGGALYIILAVYAPVVFAALFPQMVLPAANVQEELSRESCAYLRLIFLGAFPVGVKGLLIGIVQSHGDSRVSGCLSAASVVMQTFLTLFFSSFLQMGAEGSAAAVLCNNLLFCLILGVYYRKMYGMISFVSPAKISRQSWKELWKNIYAKTGMMLFLWMGSFVFQRQVNRLSEAVIAADAYVTAINNVCMEIVFAYGTAALVASGQNYGSRERYPDRWKRMVQSYNRKFLKQGLLFSACFSALFLAGGEALIRWTAGEGASGQLVAAGAAQLRIISLGYPPMAVLYVCRCALQSMGQYRIQLVLGCLTFLISLFCSFLVVPVGATMLGTCILLKLLLPGICAGVYYGKYMKKIQKCPGRMAF